MSVTYEFLTKIRESDGFKNAILTGIEVERKTNVATVTLVTDRTYTEADLHSAEEIAREYFPSALSPQIRVVKRIADEEGIRDKIMKFMSVRFPVASTFIEREEIEVELTEFGAKFRFAIPEGDFGLFDSASVLDEVSAYLSSVYCGAYYGEVKHLDRKRETSSHTVRQISEAEEEHQVKKRYFPIADYKKIDGDDETPTYAEYIADTGEEDTNLVVCGKLVFVQERESKKGKKYLTLTIDDTTGLINGAYFPKKATEEKVAKLQNGDYVVLTGEMSPRPNGGGNSYFIKKINLGRPPEGYEFEKEKGLPVPKAYHTVFPSPYVDFSQGSLFEDRNLPSALTEHTFVVFDLETTGLNNNPTMGKMDKIIELGAVKITDGKITEKFSSFVACPDRLSKEIKDITGITDEDLVGAPEVGKVLADFYKFTDGAYLVGHNVQFDYRFVRYYGGQNKYMFDATLFDTMLLAQELLRGEVANYKLDTIANKFGVVFNHHRAFDDALATAKIFIELIKMKKELPQ